MCMSYNGKIVNGRLLDLTFSSICTFSSVKYVYKAYCVL